MDENKTTENRQCSCKNDLRTFFIALLTSVIVLAIYHFGTSLCTIMCGTGNCGGMPVSREYVLVPVTALQQMCPPMGPREHFCGPREGNCRKDQHGMKFHRREKGPAGFHRKHENPFRKPECPAPEQTPAPEKAPVTEQTPAPEAK